MMSLVGPPFRMRCFPRPDGQSTPVTDEHVSQRVVGVCSGSLGKLPRSICGRHPHWQEIEICKIIATGRD